MNEEKWKGLFTKDWRNNSASYYVEDIYRVEVTQMGIQGRWEMSFMGQQHLQYIIAQLEYNIILKVIMSQAGWILLFFNWI